MRARQARKILRKPVSSKRLYDRLTKLYPAYYTEEGVWRQPSWHKYHRFAKAWVVIHRKHRKYGDNFKLL